MKIKKYILALYIFLFISLIAFSCPVSAVENGDEPSDVLDLLLRIESKFSGFDNLQTDFIQEKDLAIFRDKIIIKGRIYLQKPHKIAWHAEEPVKYSVLITDDFIRQWDEGTDRVQEIPLSKNPVFRLIVDQMTAWFSGQYVRLLDEYKVHVNRQQPLEIVFVPRDGSNVKKIIKNITVTFREDERYLKKVKFLEVSGDNTTIFFRNTVMNVPIEDDMFRVRPAKRTGRDFSAIRTSQSAR